LLNFIWIVHQVDCLYGSPLFGLSVVLHNERDVPDDDYSLLGSSDCLWRVRDEYGLGESLLGRDFGGVELEAPLVVLPEPEEDAGLACGGKLILVVVELDKPLNAVHFLVHQCLDELGLVVLPLPESDFLLGGEVCIGEGDDEGSVGVDVEG
jgi:hypothetical protein